MINMNTNVIIDLVKGHSVLSFEQILVRLENEGYKIRPTELFDKLSLCCKKGSIIHQETPKEHIFYAPSPSPSSTPSPSTNITQKETIQKIFQEIQDLEEMFGAQCPKNVLYANLADKYEISENKINDGLKYLKSVALIYYPDKAKDYIKTTV